VWGSARPGSGSADGRLLLRADGQAAGRKAQV
jgi:hypothetical protein